MIVVAIAPITLVFIKSDTEYWHPLCLVAFCLPFSTGKESCVVGGGWMRDLYHFGISAGIPFFPGPLPGTRESMALLSSSPVGSLQCI